MKRTVAVLWAVWFSVILLSAPTLADDPQPLPSGQGLAAKYPGDRGIGEDPAVLLAEDFEAGDVAELGLRWSSVSNKNGRVIALLSEAPPGSSSGRCIEMTATVGENEGGHLYQQLARGVDQAFARFYVQFPEDAGYIHHFVHLGGYHPATPWPQGGAGQRPRGDERMTVGIEPTGHSGRYPPPGVWNFYPYWHEMKPSAGNRYWGNSIQPIEPLVIPRTTWQCVEIMMKANSPGQRNGELALWLDGELAMHIKRGTPRGDWSGMGFRMLDDGGEPFEGFSWRTDQQLKINFFWLLHFVTEASQRRNDAVELAQPVSVRFANIVVSEQYIGPIVAP